ncbi:MAG: deoxynucleoside kinase [Candidatus Microgenomates bacterium]|jgi:deoxyadenosine/deoxycytidine kinase
MKENLGGKETLIKRPLVIGFVGCLASGKTTLSGELGRRWSVTPIEEKYTENPYLAKFYASPYEYSFRCQFHFMLSKMEQLEKLDINETTTIIDPSLTMDFIYAQTHHKMGWMNDKEWNLYNTAFFALAEAKHLVYPDMHVVVSASQDDLKRRIVERGRAYELWILKNYPEYLEKLSESVEEWRQEKDNNTFKLFAYTSCGNETSSVESLANRIETYILLKFKQDNRFVLPAIPVGQNSGGVDVFHGLSGESLRLRL